MLERPRHGVGEDGQSFRCLGFECLDHVVRVDQVVSFSIKDPCHVTVCYKFGDVCGRLRVRYRRPHGLGYGAGIWHDGRVQPGEGRSLKIGSRFLVYLK